MKTIRDDGEVKVEKSTDFESVVGPNYKVTVTDDDGREYIGVGDTESEARNKAGKN